MTNASAYVIFWEPAHLQSGGVASVSAGYNSLLTRFFQDVAGHSIYTLVTQYYDVAGSVKHYVQNPATELRGTYLDTTPYPTSTCSPAETNCLSDAQVRAEISKAMTAKGWTASLNNVFFLYTSSSEDECVLGTCAFATNGWCGIHNNITSGATQLLYAVMPYDIPNSCGTYQGATLEPSPNNNRTADDEISTSSHELMESITDPTGFGWYDSGGNEIGDKCDTSYTPLTWDAGKANQSWNGNFYMVQDEFNNHAGGCTQTGP